MQSPGNSTAFKPEEAYAAAAERFFELMKTFGMGSGKTSDWSALAGPLASQFERWLQMSQAAAPWLSAVRGAPGGFAFGSPATSPLGPLPLGPAAVPGTQMPHSFELLGRLAQLQGELAKHWSEIAATAAQRFIARVGATPTVPATPQQALKLYEQWVNCAEEAYAATVHKGEFAHLQAELANTAAALLAEQRQQAEMIVRAFGLPTRDEVDALYSQLKELREQLAELTRAPPIAPMDGTAKRRAPPERTAKRAAAKPAAAVKRPARGRPPRAAKGKRGRGPRR
ncbi:MAG TPA: poly(R)-hydroxyalkanoic acid synthase subunit PhaE [Steroidobacteraceae bacterium]|nr:poly(R)-hydroxyalkanoic acid synthase subunit PhaE [Steroidobacteraceae bacterium]